jgi:hypothetical protein
MDAVLDNIYSRIHSQSNPRAQPEIINNSLFCRAIWSFGNFDFTEDYHNLCKDLKFLDEDGIFFTNDTDVSGLFHWTLFQLNTFPFDISISNNTIVDDGNKLKQILYSFPNIKICFKGICKTNTGIFLSGFPSYDITEIRKKIRESISDIVEPHPQDICHMTLFRFLKTPTSETILAIDSIYEKYKNKCLLIFTPLKWEYGYGTWLQNTRIILQSWETPPTWILHRCLKNGNDPYRENNELCIKTELYNGWNIEIDIWRKNKLWFLGHDSPETLLEDTSILTHPNIWVHCKNLDALENIPKQANYFFHNTDDAVLTSKGFIWCYPGNLLGTNSVYVLPERTSTKFPELYKPSYICSDYLPSYFI